jgi:hypothetical protein
VETKSVLCESVPQGLKPLSSTGFYGTAEAVPLSKAQAVASLKLYLQQRSDRQATKLGEDAVFLGLAGDNGA